MPLHFAVELDLISLITTSDSERLPTGNSGANSLTEWKVGKKKNRENEESLERGPNISSNLRPGRESPYRGFFQDKLYPSKQFSFQSIINHIAPRIKIMLSTVRKKYSSVKQKTPSSSKNSLSHWNNESQEKLDSNSASDTEWSQVSHLSGE